MMQVIPLCHATTCARDGCGPEAGCKGHAWREAAPEHYRQQAEQLVADMAADGLVLTVEQVPVPPLAMGNYITTVAVRRALERA